MRTSPPDAAPAGATTAFPPTGPGVPPEAPYAPLPSEDVLGHYLAGLALQESEDFAGAAAAFEQALAAGGGDPSIHLALATCYLELGNGTRAEAVARLGLAAGGRDREFHELLGSMRVAEGRLDEAITEFEAARDTDPASFPVRYQLGLLLRRAGRDSAAVEELRAAADRLPEGSPVTFNLATQLEDAGALDAAAEIYAGMAADDPLSVAPRAGLARVDAKRGDSTSAVARYDEAIALDPRNYALLAEAFRLKFDMLGAGDDPAPVIAAGRRVLEVAPEDGEAALAVASLVASGGDLAGARDVLRAVPPGSSQQPAIHLLLGRLLWASGVRDSSLDEFEAAHALAPSWPHVYAPLALALLERGEEGDAASADSLLDHAFAAAPEDAGLASLSAAVKDRLGRREDAVRLYRRSLELRPDDPRVLFELGAVLERMGRIEESAATFEELLAKRPGDPLASNYLGYMLADRNMRLEESEAYIRAAVEAEPGNGYYIDSLGWVRYRRGDLEGATELLERAASLVRSAEVHAHLAEVYEKRNMTREARENWKIALELDPGNTAWRERLESLER